jgi:hypothetical protein
MKAGGAEGRRDGARTEGEGNLSSRAGMTHTVPPSRRPACQRCGFPVQSRPFGCKNPCGNCGTVYPLGDCSD